MKHAATARSQPRRHDTNLALISVILGAASFFNTIFTGIPAIIIGILALKRHAGDRKQAKLGIAFGIIGSLLIIPIIWLAIYFLRQPLAEQFAIERDDRENISTIVKALQEHKKRHGEYPDCTEQQIERECGSWMTFELENPTLPQYPMAFESQSYAIEDRPEGTLVYASRTSCFINTPSQPGSLDDDNKKVNFTDYSAFVYFHAKGRSCFSVDKNL